MEKKLMLNEVLEETGDYSPLYSESGKFLGSIHSSIKDDLDQMQMKLHAGNALYVFNRVLKTDGGVIHDVAKVVADLQLNEKWSLILLDALTLYDGGVLKLDKESVEDIFHVYYSVIGSAYLRMMEISNNPSLYYEGNVKARFTNEYNKYQRSKEEGEDSETEFRLDDYSSAVEEDTFNNYEPEKDNKSEYDGSKDYVLKMRKDEQQRELEEQAFAMPEYGFNHVTDTLDINNAPSNKTAESFSLTEPTENEFKLGGEEMKEEGTINLVETISLTVDEPTEHINKDIHISDMITAEELGFLTTPDKLNFNDETEAEPLDNAIAGISLEEPEVNISLEEDEEESPLAEDEGTELSLEEDDEDLFEDEEEGEPEEEESEEPEEDEKEEQTIQEKYLNFNPNNRLEIEEDVSDDIIFGVSETSNPQPFTEPTPKPVVVEPTPEPTPESLVVEPTPKPVPEPVVVKPTLKPDLEVISEPTPKPQKIAEQVKQTSQASLSEEQIKENNAHAEALKLAMEQMANMTKVIEDLSKQVHDLQMEKIKPKETFVQEVHEYPKKVVKEAHDNGTVEKVYSDVKEPVRKNIYNKNIVKLDEDIGYIYQPIEEEEHRQTFNDMSLTKIEEERRAIAKQVLISKGELQ